MDEVRMMRPRFFLHGREKAETARNVPLRLVAITASKSDPVMVRAERREIFPRWRTVCRCRCPTPPRRAPSPAYPTRSSHRPPARAPCRRRRRFIGDALSFGQMARHHDDMAARRAEASCEAASDAFARTGDDGAASLERIKHGVAPSRFPTKMFRQAAPAPAPRCPGCNLRHLGRGGLRRARPAMRSAAHGAAPRR